MNIKEKRKKYIVLYKKALDRCLERIRKNPAISEIVWEGFVVHLMVRDFLTHIKDLQTEIVALNLSLENAEAENSNLNSKDHESLQEEENQ